MTKNAAARKFAEEYGTYYSLTGEYRLRSTWAAVADRLKPPTTSAHDKTSLMLLTEQRDAAREVRDKVAKDRAALLTTMMALLGVEDQYADTVEEVYEPGGNYPFALGQYVNRVTKTAEQKFGEDLRAAQSAIDGEAALKRLRKAAKTVTKESK